MVEIEFDDDLEAVRGRARARQAGRAAEKPEDDARASDELKAEYRDHRRAPRPLGLLLAEVGRE